MVRSVVRDVKASLSVVWGRTWPIAAAVNRTVLSTNTTVIAANSAGLENALRWGWRLSVSQIEFILTCTYSCKLLIMCFEQTCPVQTDVQYDHSPSENGEWRVFFFSCPEWEKTHWSYAPRETRQLCCLNTKDLHSQGPEQPTHRHTNLYLWFRNRCLQVGVIQGRLRSNLCSLHHPAFVSVDAV